MSLIECPKCQSQISEEALVYPHCGYATGRYLGGYEYRSETYLFGPPLVHIVLDFGIHPVTGKIRFAKGIIAVGNIAITVVAIGGLSVGAVCLGGLAVGLLALGGAAFGLLFAAVGLVAVGGAAFGYYSIGGFAPGKGPLGGNAQDPNMVQLLRKFLSWEVRNP